MIHTEEPGVTRPSGRYWPALVALRPLQWSKSLFVLLPVPFAVAAGAAWSPGAVLGGAAGFALVTSAVYLVNDLVDRARDRRHPVKRHRPLASGALSPGRALVLALAVGGGGAALLGACAPPEASIWPLLLGYLSLQAAYSGGLKHVALLDAFVLSGGYVLRVLLGCALLEVDPSPWLLLCSSTLALFLAFAKRRGDLAEGLDESHRPSLAGYDRRFLDLAMSIAAGAALLSYALYTLDAPALRADRALAGVPFVALGILEYLRRCLVLGEGAEPVRTALGAPVMWLAGLGYTLATAWGLAG